MEDKSRGKKPRKRKTYGKQKQKEFEVNVKDSDVNAADLRPMEKRNRSKGRDNDPNWYNHYPLLTRNVTGVNFGFPVGSVLPTAGTQSNLPLEGWSIANFSAVIPGVCTIHFIPTIGDASGTLESPINKVSTQMYAAMRMLLGSTASYDGADVMNYLFSMDSAYCIYALGAKIYGLLTQNPVENRYFLKPIFSAMGIDFNSFAVNMAEFRAQLNMYAIFISSRQVPGDFDYFVRHAWLLQRLFLDSGTAKAQIYSYMLDGYYTYTEVTEGPAYCKYNELPHSTNGMFGYSDFLNVCNQIMATFTGSSDIDQMSADIGKAFKGKILQMSLIPEDYITPVDYSAEVLSQIENLTAWGPVYSQTLSGVNYAPNIIQEVDISKALGPRIVQNLYVNTPSKVLPLYSSTSYGALVAGGSPKPYTVNMHKTDISDDDVFVATRLISQITRTQNIGTTESPIWINQIGSRGSEYVTYVSLARLNTVGTLVTYNYITTNIVASTQFAYANELMSVWTAFDWAPAMNIVSLNNSTKSAETCRYQDMDVNGYIDDVQLYSMNAAAILSEFYSNLLPGTLR